MIPAACQARSPRFDIFTKLRVLSAPRLCAIGALRTLQLSPAFMRPGLGGDVGRGRLRVEQAVRPPHPVVIGVRMDAENFLSFMAVPPTKRSLIQEVIIILHPR